MDFTDLLNKYFEKLSCSSKDFSDITGISESTISRYRNGKNIPNYASKKLEKLISGLVLVAKEKKIDGFDFEKLSDEFKKSYGDKAINFDSSIEKINNLIFELDINKNKLSDSIHFNPTYISKICAGERKPSNEKLFIELISNYITENYTDESSIKSISKMTEIKDENINSNSLMNWIIKEDTNITSSINDFLKTLDEFDLNKYIKSIKFDELKVPSIPFQFSNSKNYFGLDKMKKGELDFFKHTVLSKSTDPIFMYNEMPMEDMAEDIDFGKKWMFAIAMSLKKGLRLNTIHNLNRPFIELLLGLESWIPIYMTGQVTPYYFKTSPTDLLNHALYVSGSSALFGIGSKTTHNSSMYYFTSKKEELKFYKNMSIELLKSASPLMDIYTSNNKNEFDKFINKENENMNNIENPELKKTFKNIEFISCKNKWVMIKKKKNPEINFVIYHPKLRNAIENFIAPVNEI